MKSPIYSEFCHGVLTYFMSLLPLGESDANMEGIISSDPERGEKVHCVLYCTVCATLYCIALCMLHCTVSHCVCYIVLYCTVCAALNVLHRNHFYCTNTYWSVPHCIVELKRPKTRRYNVYFYLILFDSFLRDFLSIVPIVAHLGPCLNWGSRN
jgi:hypothetical protein